MTRRCWLLLGLGCSGLVGCSPEVPGPAAATLELVLVSPAEDDGAVLLTLSGGPVDRIEAPGYQLYSTALEPGSYRVIIAGSLRAGPMARVHIPDQRRAGDYSAVVEQVAARDSYAQRDPTGYAVVIAP